MRILSWNVHRCFGTDRRYRPERIAEALREINADIVTLQEVDSSLHVNDPLGREIDQLKFLAGELGMNAVMGPTLTRDYGAYGNAVLSRFPILSAEEYDLSYRRVEPRGALGVSLEIEGRRARLVNTHLGLKYWERVFQVDKLLGELVWREEPLTILTGDFNEWIPFSGNNLRLERAFSPRSPRIATFPAMWPRFALDRIFLSGPVRDVRYHVPRTPLTRVASDHLPLLAEFSLAEETLS